MPLMPVVSAIRSLILLGSIPLMLALVLCMAGCDSAPRSAGFDAAVAHYETGRYRESFEAAVAVQRQAVGENRTRAAYVAGLSAYRLNQIDEAERRFLVAAESTSSETAGRARAMLGAIRLDQSRPLDAAEHYKAAARLLTGHEANEASYRAGRAYQAGGDWSSARAQFTIAGSRAVDPALRRDANAQLARSGFAIQVGAFSNRENADLAARDAQVTADRYGLSPARIVVRREARGELFLVQFGEFGTRESAESLRRQIGNLRWIVTRAE